MKKVLVIDDDPEIHELLKALLDPEGFLVLWAQDAASFETLAFSEKPALMILDIMLGAENGPTLYSRLLTKGLSRSIPVIFLSGLAADIKSPNLQPGRNYTMHAKPFQCDELLRDVRMLTASV